MKTIALILVTFLFLGTAFAEVHKVTESNFDDIVGAADLSLIKFFAPWCGHCKNLAPEFSKASDMLTGKVLLGNVDCTVETNLCKQFGIDGYPTLIEFRKGEETDKYKGPRNAAGIANYMKSRVGPSIKTVTSDEEIQALKDDGAATCIAKTRSENSALAKIIKEAADKMRGSATFILVTDSAVAADSAMESVTVYREGDIMVYSGDVDKVKIMQFIKDAQIPYLGEIGPETYPLYAAHANEPIGWLFMKDDTKNREELLQSVRDVAKKYRNDLLMLWINADMFSAVAGQMAIAKDAQYPVFVIDVDRQHHILPKQVTSGQDVEEFVQKYLKGGVEPTMLSEEVPAEETKDGLTTIVGSTVPKYLQQDNDLMILFHAPWCGHCKKLMPVYEELAKSLEGSGVTIARIDAVANDFDRKNFIIQGFPTIYFISKDKAPVSYEGDRSLADLQEFVKKHASKPLNIDEKAKKSEGAADETEGDL